MPLINRDKASVEQCDNFDMNFGNSVLGVSSLIQIGVAPCLQQIIGYQVVAFGVSGTPVLNLQIQRFIAGSGNTIITGGFTALSVSAAYGTSGALAFISGLTAGSTLTQIQANDVLQVVTSGANSAATYCGNIVLKCLQDYKSLYGQTALLP
jgi:hypothetical protein